MHPTREASVSSQACEFIFSGRGFAVSREVSLFTMGHCALLMPFWTACLRFA